MKNRVALYATNGAKPPEHIVAASTDLLLKAGAIAPSDTLRNAWAFGPDLEEVLGVTADSQGWVTICAFEPAANVAMGMIQHGDADARSHFIITVHCASLGNAAHYRPTPLLAETARMLGPGVEFNVLTFYM